MTDDQRHSYNRARRASRDAMRQVNNEREDLAIQFGGGAGCLADNHEIPDGAARAIARAHQAVMEIASELGSAL